MSRFLMLFLTLATAKTISHQLAFHTVPKTVHQTKAQEQVSIKETVRESDLFSAVFKIYSQFPF